MVGYIPPEPPVADNYFAGTARSALGRGGASLAREHRSDAAPSQVSASRRIR